MTTTTISNSLDTQLDDFDRFLDELETETEATLARAEGLTINTPTHSTILRTFPWAVFALGICIGAALVAIAVCFIA